MSYDIVCYKSQLGRPDLEEAWSVIDADEMGDALADQGIKMIIANALMSYNPRLERFEFDYDEIAKIKGIGLEEARAAFTHIELNTPDGDLATQITIFENSVSITVPYWYSGDKAETVFKKISDYTKIIRQVAGYFVYDPQQAKVFDPLVEISLGTDIYEAVMDEVRKKMADQDSKKGKKPWWKWW